MKNSTSENSEFQTDDGLVVCPLSLDRANLVSDFKLHHCRPEELAANGGICAACRKRAARLNGNFKTQDGQPVDMSHRHEPPDLEQDHACFNANGEVEQTTNFDYAEVDRLTHEHFAELDKDTRQEAGTALGLILQWIWARDLRTALRRLVVVTGGLRPELLGNKGFPELALELNTTKQALSKAMIGFQNQFRIKFSRGRSEEARRIMANAQAGHRGWSTKKKPKLSNTPSP